MRGTLEENERFLIFLESWSGTSYIETLSDEPLA